MGSHSGGADPEQAWPQSSGEEDLQLQLALAMSKEEAEQVTQNPLVESHRSRLLLTITNYCRTIHRGILFMTYT